MQDAPPKVTLWKAFEVIREASEEDLRSEMLEMGNVSRIRLLQALQAAVDTMRNESQRLAGIDLNNRVAEKRAKRESNGAHCMSEKPESRCGY